MLNKILEYEKRLLEDREQLRRLMESSEKNAGIEQDKLNFFRAELAYMNKQLELLKQQQTQPAQMPQLHSQPVQPPVPPLHSQPVQPVRPPVPPLHSQPVQPVPQQMPPQYSQPAQHVPQQIPPQFHQSPKKEVADFEKKFGKTFMGIVASVLIFISIILFATLLIPALNDTIKMIVTYIVSFIILGLGCFKLHKNQKDRFYLALTGCGMGALYISLLLSNMYFNILGDIPLYALIAVWAAGICVLSKYNNLVFQIIGQIGIVISMLCGVILCVANGDAGKFTVLIIFYILTSAVLYMTHFKRRFCNNWCAHVANLLNLHIILAGSFFLVGYWHYTYIIILTFILAHIVVSYLCTWTEKEFVPGVIISMYGLLFIINMISFVQDDNWRPIMIYGFMMLLHMAAEFKRAGKDYSKTIVQIFTVAVAFLALHAVEVLMLHGLVPLLIAPLLAIGFWRENKGLKIMALIISFYYVIVERDIHDMEWFITGAVLVGALYSLVFFCKKQYSVIYKGFVHVLGVLFVLITGTAAIESFHIDGDVSFAVSYIVAALLNIAIMKSPFAKNRLTGAEEKAGLYNGINMLMMVIGLPLIHMDIPFLLHLLVVFVTLGVFMVNARNLMDKYPNGFGGAYVGIKFTIFMLVVLSAYDATNYVVSIACFIFAVASIVLGFACKYKSLRIYGLVLCMISVFKLIVMDIEYADTLGYAVSFFVAGVLCFAISLLYNFVDKRMKNSREE